MIFITHSAYFEVLVFLSIGLENYGLQAIRSQVLNDLVPWIPTLCI